MVVAVVLALIGLVLFNPFTGGDDAATTAAPTSEVETTPAPEGTPTAPETGAPTTTAPTTAPTPTHTPTQTPSSTPTDSESPTPKPSSTTPTTSPTTEPVSTGDAVVYQSCAEVRAAGKAPLYRGQPGYTEELDRNGDGIACDKGNS
jgi:outer membrane biosynthesis protein TonB